MVVLLTLLFLSPAPKVKTWFLLFLLSFAFWAQPILFSSNASAPFWFYVLPIGWIVLTLWQTFPKTLPQDRFSFQTEEPRETLELLRGPRGTREALRIYFTVVFLVLVTGLLFFKLTLSSTGY